MRSFGAGKHPLRLAKKALAFLIAAVSLSCAPTKVQAIAPNPAHEAGYGAEAIKHQLSTYSHDGMRLSFDECEVAIPSKDENHPNVLDFGGASGSLRLQSLSVHGVDFILDAPFSYNGLDRYLNLSLLSDDLYFSLDALNDAETTYNVKYHANLTSYDEGGIDGMTQGISYFEYGELDYFVYTILQTLGVSSIDLNWHSEEKGTFDAEAILDSFDAMEEVDSSRFRVDIPIGEETLPLGLVHDGDYVLTGIEFPIHQSGVPSSYEFSNGLSVDLFARIEDAAPSSFTPAYDTSAYVDIVDSLALFRTIASYANAKKFGIGASFELLHSEDAVEGDDDHFEREAVSEAAYLNLSSNLDFSSSFIDGLNAEITFGQHGGNESVYGIYTTQVEDDTRFYLNLDEILKVYTPVDVGSALISSLVDAFSDESIQNEDIMKLLGALLASGEGILKVIEVVKESDFGKNIENGYYESVLASVSELDFQDNSIRIVIDLTKTGLQGTATVLLNGTSESAKLASITLSNVGAKADNASKTSLYINGTLDILPYEASVFDPSEYVELTHLPGWDEEIQAIAETDQLSVTLEGYVLKTGTTSVITNKAANYNRTEQGFTFSGSLAFDLKERLGTGKMTFTDRKEGYVNDHTLQIDVTGPEGENDTDLNDMTGSGNQNAMYFQYDSKNVTETKGSTAYNNENRTEPDNSPLKGRFSIHSLDGILKVVQELSGSTDVRFERLTSLIGRLSAETLLTKVMAGQYFELLATGVLQSAEIEEWKTTLVVRPGIIQQNTGMTLILGYDTNLKPKTIEVYMTLEGDENDTEVYAKITLGNASFPGYQFSSHSSSEFTDFSSLKTLAQFAIDTISLGMTDDTANSWTTYNLTGTADLKLLGIYTVTVTINVNIYLKGTRVLIFGTTHIPKVLVATNAETACDFFYETDGADEGGTMYLCRHTAEKYGFLNLQTRDKAEHCKIKGSDFGSHILDWVCGYMLNFGDTIMDSINGEDQSVATESMHGEDIIRSFSVASASLTAPSWTLNIDLGALAHTSILGELPATITGIQAKYTGSDGKNYQKNALYSLSGQTSILGIVIKATLSFKVGNINESTGAYTDAWYSQSTYAYTKYDKTKYNGTANAIWNSSYGKTSANNNYTSASWRVTP